MNESSTDAQGRSSVSAIVVNWNGAELLDDCLKSLRVDGGPDQVIVVDNGSSDTSAAVATAYRAEWIGLPANMGLAYAFNEGARRAHGDVLLFLNNDVALPASFCSQVTATLQSTGAGAIDASHWTWDGMTPTHQCTTFRPDLGTLDENSFPEVGRSSLSRCAYASGACFAISADIFKTVGEWDGGFFAGWEDVDLAWRLWLAGFEVLYDPSLKIQHRVSASSNHKEGQRARTYAAMTGRPRFALKHAPRSVAILCLGRLLLGFVRDVRAPSRVLLRLRALAVTAVDMPQLLLWRRSTYREFGVRPGEHWDRVASMANDSAGGG